MRSLVCSLLFSMTLSTATVWAAEKAGFLIPHEADIISTDQTAVQRLGDGRGARTLKSDIRNIQWNTTSTREGSSTSSAASASSTNNPGLLIPHEADILFDDQLAVERLGEGRGARTLKADIRNIIENSADTKATSLNLKQAMVDLEAEVRKTEILIKLSTDVLFDFDKAEIKTDAEIELHKLALIIKEKAKGAVTINGHTDSKGSDDYNQALSLRRAKIVQTWLIEKGGAEADFNIVGYGETQPAAPNTTPEGKDNPEGRAQNRRVEISIKAVKS